MHPIDAPAPAQPELVVGRYSVFRSIGRGGMATVHLGRLAGPLGFTRTVALKRIHPHLARDPRMVAMFIDEARLASRVQHPNVVAMLDILHEQDVLFLVMDFVLGESLAGLQAETRRRGSVVPIAIGARIMADVLGGLHAAHCATDARGKPLSIIHRDVAPHNVVVGIDGLARVTDFGIAKAAVRLAKTTGGNELLGRVRYMAPEQLLGHELTHRVDLYSAGVMLWELLSGSQRFSIQTDEAILRNPQRALEPPSQFNPNVTPELDQLVLRALHGVPEQRFADALEMGAALERATRCASANEVASWVADVGAARIAELRLALREIEEAAGAPSMSPSLLSLLPELGGPSAAPEDEAKTTLYQPDRKPVPAVEFTETGTEIIQAPSGSPVLDDETATAVSRPDPREPTTTVKRVGDVKTRPPRREPSMLLAFVAGALVVLVTVLVLILIWQYATR
jgi:serine/threonine-protein kinase